MKSGSRPDDLFARIQQLVAVYRDTQASAGHLLCDRHDSSAVAFRLVSSDLKASELTYGALREQSERFAAALSSVGIRQGDRVATLLGKSREYLITIMAIWRLGAVHVPLFTAFAPPAIVFRLVSSGTKVVVSDRAQQCKLAPGGEIPFDPPWHVITTAPNDNMLPGSTNFWSLLEAQSSGFPTAALGGDAPIIQMYTSGTTGKPKGVIVPLRAVAGFQTYGEFGLDLQSTDVFWNAADPGWGYGLFYGVLAALSSGVGAILLEAGFSSEVTFAVLSRYEVTNFAAAPTVYRSLRASGLVPPTGLKLRCASSAGEPLTPDVNEWSVTALGVRVHDHYGQTESGMMINNHHHPAVRRPLRPGSMGHPLPGWSAAVLRHDRDELASTGELGRLSIDIARSPLAWFKGYVNDPERSAEKFSIDCNWYLTGDTARMDENGYFYFSSRDDDVIIMAGYRIGPFEIELVIVTHDAVSECAVVAVPDEIRGEILEAVVVLREGRSGSLALTKELQDWVKSRYAAHAYPRRIHYVDTLPKTPSGKVQRFILRQQLRDQARLLA